MSWDILLRKRVFAKLASSAFFRAISNLSLSFCVSFAASFAAASAFLAFHKSTRIMPMMTSDKNPAVTIKASALVSMSDGMAFIVLFSIDKRLPSPSLTVKHASIVFVSGTLLKF